MRRLIAIVIIAAALSGAVLVLAVMTLAGPAFSAAAPQGRMQACTQQWLDMKAAGRTAGLGYRAFEAQCMKNPGLKNPDMKSPDMKSMSKDPPQIRTLAAPMTAKHVKLRHAKRTAGGKKPNRMKLCGAQWRQMKADGRTNGQTYRQFSKQCLKAT